MDPVLEGLLERDLGKDACIVKKQLSKISVMGVRKFCAIFALGVRQHLVCHLFNIAAGQDPKEEQVVKLNRTVRNAQRLLDTTAAAGMEPTLSGFLHRAEDTNRPGAEPSPRNKVPSTTRKKRSGETEQDEPGKLRKKRETIQKQYIALWMNVFTKLALLPSAGDGSRPLKALQDRPADQRQVLEKCLLNYRESTLKKHLANWLRWEDWAHTAGADVWPLDPLDVSLCISEHNCEDCGATVPGSLRDSFRWVCVRLETVQIADLPCIRDQALAAAKRNSSELVQARRLTVEIVKKVELVTQRTDVKWYIRFFARLILAMVFGTLRWADLLHTAPAEIWLTSASICAAAWLTKPRSGQKTRWSAVRCGFTGVDWASELEKDLRPLRGQDFSAPMPSKDWTSYINEPLDYGRALSIFRHVLHIAGLTGRETRLYTLHSPRHVMPNLAIFLRHARSNVQRLGRWADESMVTAYEEDLGAIPLAVQQDVVSQIQSGWQEGERGDIPMPRCEAPCSSAAAADPSCERAAVDDGSSSGSDTENEAEAFALFAAEAEALMKTV